MLDENQLARLRGATLIARDAEAGQIDEVYAHSSDDAPALVAVAAGGRRVLVPLPRPEAEISGDRVTVPFDAEAVTAAPEAAGGDAIADDTFAAVYEHFGISDATMREDTGLGGTGRA